MSKGNNKELLELLASLQIQGAVAEMERQVDAKEVDARFLAQVIAMLKHHEVKADIKEVSDLNESEELERLTEESTELYREIRSKESANTQEGL